jgi:ribosomal protein S18 acetylase RimI-like enzyme
MSISIRPLGPDNVHDLNQCDGAFIVNARLILTADPHGIRYTFADVPPYLKRYPADEGEAASLRGSAEQAAFLAYDAGAVVGQIRLRRNWNRFAYVDDLVVDGRHRRRGIGRALLQQAIAWARDNALAGLMLETQDINVAACRLYASCGFELGGWDRCLYQGLMPGTTEIALFWYLVFR